MTPLVALLTLAMINNSSSTSITIIIIMIFMSAIYFIAVIVKLICRSREQLLVIERVR